MPIVVAAALVLYYNFLMGIFDKWFKGPVVDGVL